MLSVEEKEALLDFAGTEGYKAMRRLIDEIVKAQERAVLSFPMASGDAAKIAYLKCIAEGAAKVPAILDQDIEALKKARKQR